MTAGNFPGLSAFFIEMKHPLVLIGIKVPHPEPGHRADPDRHVYQNGDDCLIPRPNQRRCVDRFKEFTRLFRGNRRRLSFLHTVARTADRGSGVDDDGMPGHGQVEEMPNGREMLLFAGSRSGMAIKISPNVPGRNLRKLEPLVLAPGQNSSWHAHRLCACVRWTRSRTETPPTHNGHCRRQPG